jgi:hypothetical protein
MAEPTLTDIFGAGATQTAATITIAKADLDLTASGTNRAETLLAGIVKKAATALSTSNFNTNLDQSIQIAPGFDQIIYRTVNNNPTTYYQSQLTLNFAKLQSAAGITPDEY